MPIIRKCAQCGNGFKTKPFFIKKGEGKFCSRKCSFESRKNGKYVKCDVCKKEVYKTKKELRVSKSKKYFCSRSCQTKWRNQVFIGKKHANWVDGLYAYKSVLKRNNVKEVCNICKTKDSRVLAVHHIDKNRKNNSVENLCYLCHNCHHLVHHDKNVQEQFNKMVAVAQR